jgi:calcyclin binding protein
VSSVDRREHRQLKDYSWDQSDKFVKIYLTNLTGLAGISSDKVKVEYAAQSVNVQVLDLGGKDFSFGIKQTCHEIDPSGSHHKVKADYLLVLLAKRQPGTAWSHITRAEKEAADVKSTAVESKPSKNKDKDPSSGLMDMMKKMYEDGDDEMKRTIAKAWTEGQEKKVGRMSDTWYHFLSSGRRGRAHGWPGGHGWPGRAGSQHLAGLQVPGLFCLYYTIPNVGQNKLLCILYYFPPGPWHTVQSTGAAQ